MEQRANDCTVVKISSPVNVNVPTKVQNIYSELKLNFQIFYPDYKSSFVTIIIGAFCSVVTHIHRNIEVLVLPKRSKGN